MTNLCRAAFFALSFSGALSVATPVLALSGGASCDDTNSARYGYAPGRFSPLPPRHERRMPTRAAWSPPPRPGRLGPARERPAWAYRSPGLPERNDPKPTESSASSDTRSSTGSAPILQPPARPDRLTGRMTPESLRSSPPSRPAWNRRPPPFDYPARLRAPGGMWFPRRPPFVPFSPPWPVARPTAPEAASTGATTVDEAAAAGTTTPPPPAVDTMVAPQRGVPSPEVTDVDGDGIADTTDFCAGTLAGTTVDAFGCTETETIVLRGVNFQGDSAQLTDDSGPVLDNVAATLIAHPEIHVEIAGHTDSDGDAEHNFDLSARRAIMVMKYLADAGVSPDNMIARGYGEDRPVSPNDTPEGKAANRRVELSPLD